ncbi:MAG: hypothetical protein COU47_03435 [Candidatus Niyogibacteria bacterium CG10_big_fil_rev_8_21_14_0_10_46_36]|uniref:DUF7282 domain-containing protein n=1 Tax=Candidatus Niyogibacteria bacterium CG10_big_fil_rev_8_21_14_0_10_46_36 TaxID=1974726 RepID=A0A2H0TCW0_9BACT|nr:MAG: hypothetical protein COU47_03435 [Candidatus Niyogibacteria bacterium CG10_big_fil_rev_8_21_14_0_10_46_36]
METDIKKRPLLIPVILPLLTFVLGFGFAWLVFSGGGADDTTNNESNTASDAFSIPLGHSSVSVDDQRAGESVFIALATLSRGAWVAIHEDQDGMPANILGARYFPGGKTAGTVELLRGTVPERAYYAVIHADDGDREFDFRRDEALQDPFGNLIMSAFRTFSEEAPNGSGTGQ